MGGLLQETWAVALVSYLVIHLLTVISYFIILFSEAINYPVFSFDYNIKIV